MIKALLVDDEPQAIKSLKILLEKYCPEVNVLGEAENITEAYQLIQKENPNLVFLDINMPGGTGIELLEQLDGLDLEVIFTTAHHEFAVKALRLSALDYLLKPIDSSELRKAVSRYTMKNWRMNDYSIVKEVLAGDKPKKIAINALERIHIINVEDILYLKSDKNYTSFFLSSEEIIASKPLGEFEELLRDYGFIRSHRSTIINIERVKEFKKGRDPYVLLDNGAQLEVSRTRKDELLSKLKGNL